MDFHRLISQRARGIDASGIRRVSDLGKTMQGAINLSIGQPEFPVPEPIKKAAIDAIADNKNGYTGNPGLDALRVALADRLRRDVGWSCSAPGLPARDTGLMITSGTSGGLMLACMAVLNEGDEIIIPDPYFVSYPHLATLCGARAVACDTYPDFRLTAARVEPLITPRTKALIYNSPGNPSGVIGTEQDCRELLDLCRARNILLISDEIYDEFTFSEACTQDWVDGSRKLCPSPARLSGAHNECLLIRGFGKTYGVTGWRLGFAAGPAPLLEQMIKIQQYTFVCAPTPLQWGVLSALDVDMAPQVAVYQRRRDRVVERLSRVTEVTVPGGAFYAFPRIPARLGLTGQQFIEKAIEHKLLVIPGNVFSARDTHVRLSFAVSDSMLDQGLDVLTRMMA